jgi:hypothetical protein
MLHRDRDKKRRRRRARLEPVPQKPLVEILPQEYTKSCVLVHLKNASHRPILRRRGDADRIYDRVRPGEGRFRGEVYGIPESRDDQTTIRMVAISASAEEIELTG